MTAPSHKYESVAAAATPTPVRDVIVVGVDGSEASKQALRWAASLGRTLRCSLEVVAVWEPFNAHGWLGLVVPTAPSDWNPLQDSAKALTSMINEVLAENRRPVLTTSVHEGDAAKILLDQSDTAQMLVVGSRGHGGFADLLLGSVSTACANHATCPVLVVHGTMPPPD
jgi:nucleotide-binding universal stress UspA family protein